MLWGIKNVGLKSTGFPLVYRRGVDMHALTFRRLFKVSTTKMLTFLLGTYIISRNLLYYPERF